MKKFVFIFVLIFFLTGCTTTDLKQVKVGDKIFEVESVNTEQDRYQGLSGRESLSEKAGMLFVFDEYNVQTFIMRDMNFPLDMVWIRDNEVVGCSQNIQILNAEGDFTRVNSSEEVNYVLEINAGECEKNGIVAGSHFQLLTNNE